MVTHTQNAHIDITYPFTIACWAGSAPRAASVGGCVDRLSPRVGLLALLRHRDRVASGGDAIGGSGQRLGRRRRAAAAGRPAVALPGRDRPRRRRVSPSGGRAAAGSDLRRRRGAGRLDRRHRGRRRVGVVGPAVAGRVVRRRRGLRQPRRPRSGRRARALSTRPGRPRLGAPGRGDRGTHRRFRRRASARPRASARVGAGRRDGLRRRRGRCAPDRRDRSDHAVVLHQPRPVRGGRGWRRRISVAHLGSASRIRDHGGRGHGRRGNPRPGVRGGGVGG